MQYLTLRWFTLSRFDENKFKLFHSLERALKNAGTENKSLCWQIQTEDYLKQEFKKIKMTDTYLIKLKKFDTNFQNFLNQNKTKDKFFIKNLDFLHQCDYIIYRRTHANNNASDNITSLP